MENSVEPFRLHILGCGSAVPTLRHHPSSQLVEIHDKVFMIDCGEGTQVQLRRSKVHFFKIIAIFISHLHGDHCLGLIGLISSFGLLGRTAPLHIYAPKGFEAILNLQLQTFCPHLEYKIVFHALDTRKTETIYEDRSVTVSTIPLEHRTPCAGFLFQERPKLPHIRREMIDFYDIPVCQINNIKAGKDWVLDDGTVIENSRLVIPAAPPRSYAYCSDTRYMRNLHKSIKHVSTLYHEATYLETERDYAEKYAHSTALEAAQVAKAAQARQLLLGHFSSRYTDEKLFQDEAREIFQQSFIVNEGDIFDI